MDPWVKKIPWRGKGNPLQYSCLENSMDRGAWQATVHGVAELDKTEQLSTAHKVLLTKFKISYYSIGCVTTANLYNRVK